MPPGEYTIRLTVNGKTYTQTAMVTNDPRSPATTADIRAQHALIKKIQDGIRTAWNGYQQVHAMRTSLNEAAPPDSGAGAAKAIVEFRARLDTVGGNAEGGRGFAGRSGGRTPPPNFAAVHGRLVGQLTLQDNGDLAPTEAMRQGFATTCRDLAQAVTAWQAINARDLSSLNAALTKGGRRAVTAATGVAAPKC